MIAVVNVLFIIAQQDFRDEELLDPKDIFEEEGYECTISSIEEGKAQGKLGAVVAVDIAVQDVDIERFDLLVLVGGPGAPGLVEHKEVLDLLQNAKGKVKLIAAICISPLILAKAGLLKGKRATVFECKEGISALENGGAIYVKEDVVVDADIVTAAGPWTARDFAEKIVELLTA